MPKLNKKYRVEAVIAGGGLLLRKGEIVAETALRGFAKILERKGAVIKLPPLAR